MKKIIILAIAAILTLGANAQQVSKGEQTVTIQTNGVCQKCADKFKENVPYFKGVKSYSYDMKTAKLTINYDAKKTNPDQLRTEVSKLGYNADNVKADPAARAKLPACCRAEKGAGGCSGHGGGQGCGNHGAEQKSCAGHAQGGEHKCANAQGGEHKCANAQGGEHKCANAQGGEHKCAGHDNGEHKCPNAQAGEKKACDHHAPDASKAEAEGNPNKHNVKSHPEDPDRVRK